MINTGSRWLNWYIAGNTQIDIYKKSFVTIRHCHFSGFRRIYVIL